MQYAWLMTKAKTENMYKTAYEKLAETHQFCADWLHERESSFATYLLLGRRGIVTSNPVEQFNNTIREARSAPISDALLMLLNQIAEQTVHRKNLGKKWKEQGHIFVPKVVERYQANLADGLTRQVILRQHDLSASSIVIGDVCKPGPVPDVNSMLTVQVNVNNGMICCGCNFTKEYGIPCLHAIALIHAIGLNSFDPLFFDVGLTVEAYIKEYNYSPVPLGMIKIHQRNTKVIEPDHRIVKAGRPKKIARITGSGVRICELCCMLF